MDIELYTYGQDEFWTSNDTPYSRMTCVLILNDTTSDGMMCYWHCICIQEQDNLCYGHSIIHRHWMCYGHWMTTPDYRITCVIGNWMTHPVRGWLAMGIVWMACYWTLNNTPSDRMTCSQHWMTPNDGMTCVMNIECTQEQNGLCWGHFMSCI